LRVDAPLLGKPDLAQLIFGFGLEIQRGHVIQQQRQTTAITAVVKASGGDRFPIPTRADLIEVTGNRAIRHRRRAQIGQHPLRIGLARGLHDPGDHQIPEHAVGDRVEPQPVVDAPEDVVEQPRTGTHRAPRRHQRADGGLGRLGDQRPLGAEIGHLGHRLRPRGYLEIECGLPTSNDLTTCLEQNAQLSIGMRRT
jgi:hypothetical protein